MANQLLFHAVSCADIEQIQSLLTEAHADVNYQNALGETPLHHATERNLTSTVELLLSYGANPNVRSKENVGSLSPLIVAARNDFVRCAEMILAANADPDLKDSLGLSALHHAVRCGSVRMVRLLLLAGANPDTRDSMGRWPISWAKDLHHTEIVNILSSVSPGASLGAGGGAGAASLTEAAATGAAGGRKGAPHGWLQRVAPLQDSVVWQERQTGPSTRPKAKPKPKPKK